MTNSDSEEDPRFRIPRGDSDEEIDSDCASGPESAPTASRTPSKRPQRPDTSSVTNDSDSSDDETLMLSDMLSSTPRTARPSASPTRRQSISDAAAVLKRGLARTEAVAPLPRDDDDDNADPDDGALEDVTYAATGRRDLDRSALRAARDVIPCSTREHEHALPTDQTPGQKEMMSRMLAVLGRSDGAHDGPATANLGSLKKKIARLEGSGKKALSVPLPRAVAGRIERAAAYERTTADVTERWAGIVQKNRKAKQLVFPLNGPGKVVRNTGNVVEGFTPSNEYEEEIEDLLKEAGVEHDKGVLEGEERELGDGMGMGKLSKEELLERRRELAKVRSLMFHYEHKMKRIKKIKSRKYRRIMKREKEKVDEMGDFGGGDEQDEAIRAEKRRAEERMTLRHKNTSKWVRRQLQRGEAKRNPETRAAIEEQLQLHQELKRRQEGVMDDSDAESDSDRSVEQNEEELQKELEDIRHELDSEIPAAEAGKKQKKVGLMSMKFMQAAQERKRKDAMALLNEMGEDNSDEDREAGSREYSAGFSPPATAGRQSFAGPLKDKKKTKKRSGTATEHTRSDGGADIDEVEDAEDVSALKERVISEYTSMGDQKELYSQPGAGGSESLEKLIQDGNSVQAGFTTRLGDRLVAGNDNPWLSSVASGTEKASTIEPPSSPIATERREEHTEVLTDPVPEGRTASDIANGKSSSAKKRVRFTKNDSDGNSGATVHQDESKAVRNARSSSKVNVVNGKAKSAKKRKITISNNRDKDAEAADMARMELVSQAFAGAGGADEADFKTAKDAEITNQLPTAKAIGAEVLPGWGAWDGAGTRKRRGTERKESAFARAARERLEAARASAIAGRADRNLDHVILDERRVRRAADLTLSAVPFPFTSAAQWEREVSVPIARELQTGAAFEGTVKGRVVRKLGVPIAPIRHGAPRDKGRGVSEQAGGKKGVIDLRREKSSKRSASRRGLMS